VKLDKNEISGTIPSTLSNLKQLEVLHLSSNNIKGTLPEELNKLSTLGKCS